MSRPMALVVCTGNVCRSPALQMLLERSADARSWTEVGIDVMSAGTAALVGNQLDPTMRRALVDLGVTPDDSFAGQQVTTAMIESAAVVLAATRDHRARVFRLAPSALRRTFTIAEFAARSRSWPARGDDAEHRLKNLVEYAAQSRSEPTFKRPADEDVVDPFGRSQRVHRQTALRLREAARELNRVIAP